MDIEKVFNKILLFDYNNDENVSKFIVFEENKCKNYSKWIIKGDEVKC